MPYNAPAMDLHAGTTPEHDGIAYKIGEGPNGVVRKAVDTTLDCEATIKVLPVTSPTLASPDPVADLIRSPAASMAPGR